MRILKGYSKAERKELEKAKDNGFLSAITLINGVGIDDGDCHALSEKYCHEYTNENNQLAKDIADFYCGNAKFPDKKYVVHDSATDQYIYYTALQGNLRWGDLKPCAEKNTKEEWLAINPAYEPMLERVEN